MYSQASAWPGWGAARPRAGGAARRGCWCCRAPGSGGGLRWRRGRQSERVSQPSRQAGDTGRHGSPYQQLPTARPAPAPAPPPPPQGERLLSEADAEGNGWDALSRQSAYLRAINFYVTGQWPFPAGFNGTWALEMVAATFSKYLALLPLPHVSTEFFRPFR